MSDSLFAVLIETSIPRDCLVVALRHVFLDESGTNKGDRFLTVAGYVFLPEQAARFSRDWLKVLKNYRLPYAHMTDAVCGNGVYTHLDDNECDKINRLLIEHIKRRTRFGFAVTVDRQFYDREVAPVPQTPSCYAFCVSAALKQLGAWAAESGDGNRYAYFLESGHQHQSEANRIMNHFAKRRGEQMDGGRYFSHTFIAKCDAPPLQAADMLAWSMNKYLKDEGKRQRRKDFTALLRAGDWMSEYKADKLLEFKETILAANRLSLKFA